MVAACRAAGQQPTSRPDFRAVSASVAELPSIDYYAAFIMASGQHQGEAGSADAAGTREADEGAVALTDPARPVRATPTPRSTPGEAEQHVQAALAAGTRTGANLSALFRAVEQMTDGLSGAREANQQLVAQLQSMRQMLDERIEENASLERQLAALASERDNALRELEQIREDARRERGFLVDEQDRFLAALLEDHEQALDALRRERDEARTRATVGPRDPPTRPGTPMAGDNHAAETAHELLEARHTIEKLMTERNRSREMLRQLRAQRDEAQAALAGAGDSDSDTDTDPLNVTVKAAPAGSQQDSIAMLPPQPVSGRKQKRGGRTTAPQGPRALLDEARSERITDPLQRSALAQAAEATRPESLEVSGTPPWPAGAAPTAPTGAPRRRSTEPGIAAPTLPPDELRAAITAAPAPRKAPEPASVPAPTDGKPALKRKPDPASRPLGGYSLGEGEIEAERVEGAQLTSSKPPRR